MPLCRITRARLHSTRQYPCCLLPCLHAAHFRSASLLARSRVDESLGALRDARLSAQQLVTIQGRDRLLVASSASAESSSSTILPLRLLTYAHPVRESSAVLKTPRWPLTAAGRLPEFPPADMGSQFTHRNNTRLGPTRNARATTRQKPEQLPGSLCVPLTGHSVTPPSLRTRSHIFGPAIDKPHAALKFAVPLPLPCPACTTARLPACPPDSPGEPPPNPCKSYLAPSIAWAIVRT